MLFILISTCYSLINYEITECQTTITYKGSGLFTTTDAENAKGKKKVILSEGITEIESYAFSQTRFQSSALDSFIFEEIELPCSLITIGEYAFQNYYSELRKIHFPDYPYGSSSESGLENYYSLRKIGRYAFDRNYKILCHNIPATFTEVDHYTFYSCSIRHIGLNSKITSIGSYSFQHCTSLRSIRIPCIVRYIYEGAFYNCQQLQNIFFDNDVEMTMSRSCFYNCSSLLQVNFPPNTNLDESYQIFFNCTSLTSVFMPKLLRGYQLIVPDDMFKDCIKLRYCTFPENIATISENMFMNTSIEKVYLPSSVSRISRYAFADCPNLRYVEILPKAHQNFYIEYNAFYNCPNIEKMVIKGQGYLYLDNVYSLGGSIFCLLDPFMKSYHSTTLFQYPTVVYSTEEYTGFIDLGGYNINVENNGVCSLPIQTPFPVQSYDPYDNYPWNSDCSGYPGAPSCGGQGGWTENIYTPTPYSDSYRTPTRIYNPSKGINPTKETNPIYVDKDDDGGGKKKGLSAGAIVGIVIACVVVVVVVLIIICGSCFVTIRRKQQISNSENTE